MVLYIYLTGWLIFFFIHWIYVDYCIFNKQYHFLSPNKTEVIEEQYFIKCVVGLVISFCFPVALTILIMDSISKSINNKIQKYLLIYEKLRKED